MVPQKKLFLILIVGLASHVHAIQDEGNNKSPTSEDAEEPQEQPAKRVYNFGLGKREDDDTEIHEHHPLTDDGYTIGKRSVYTDFDKRANFQFGLGKRDQQFENSKRAFQFGLGKREDDQILNKKAYEFGLGKREIDEDPFAKRYSDMLSFGLGKRGRDAYSFGLGKRGRDAFNFGLGKREFYEDADKRAREAFRFGLGKRGGAMYGFGLGKRGGALYKFGLGKRGYSGLHSFGLGKKSGDYPEADQYVKRGGTMYGFGLGKRDLDEEKRGGAMYGFGLGKRSDAYLGDNNMYEQKVKRGLSENLPLSLKRALQQIGVHDIKVGRRTFGFGLGKRSVESDNTSEQ